MAKGIRRSVEQQIADLEKKKQELLEKQRLAELKSNPVNVDVPQITDVIQAAETAIKATGYPVEVVLSAVIAGVAGQQFRLAKKRAVVRRSKK